MFALLALPALQTKYFFANSVDHYEPSHQDLHSLPFCFEFWLRSLFGTMVLTRFKDGRVHFRNSGMTRLKPQLLLFCIPKYRIFRSCFLSKSISTNVTDTTLHVLCLRRDVLTGDYIRTVLICQSNQWLYLARIYDSQSSAQVSAVS